VIDDGLIAYDYTALGLCGGVTNAPLTTTTEVYPDSPKATDELCNLGQVTIQAYPTSHPVYVTTTPPTRQQVASVTSALDYLLASRGATGEL
jgi:hypothetical protein